MVAFRCMKRRVSLFGFIKDCLIQTVIIQNQLKRLAKRL